jgi:hypothetical protein
MGVQFTQEALNTLAEHGVSQENLQNTINHYREEGWTDDAISDGLWGKIKELNPHLLSPSEIEERSQARYPGLVKQMAEYGLAPGDYGEGASYTERWRKDNERLREAARARAEEHREKAEKYEKRMAAVASWGSSASLGLSDLMMWGKDKIFGTDDVKAAKEARENHPDEAFMGNIAGVLTPGGAFSSLYKGVTVGAKTIGIAPMARAAKGAVIQKVGENLLGKALGVGADVVATAVGTQALFTAEETARKVAETESFAAGDKALEDFGEGAALNAGIDTAFRVAGGVVGRVGGPIAKKIGEYTNKTKAAVGAMGGEENVIRSQQAAKAVINAGGTKEQASAAFFATMVENMPLEARKKFEKTLLNNEEFRHFMQQQMAGSKGVVTDSINALTKPEYGKASSAILESLWGSAENKLGSSEIDFTKKGLERLLGLDNEQAVLNARKQGLARAEKKVMNDPRLADEVRYTFDELRDDLITNGSRDLERAANLVEQGTLKSFEGSIEQSEALARAQERIAEATQKAMDAGRQFTKAEADDIMVAELRNGAKKHFKNIMAEGTDSVMDINDIKEFFKAVDESAVKAGQAEAFGAFNEGVNTQILDRLDETLYKANQAQRFGKKLGDMHDFGRKYTPDRFNELESTLNNGVSAEEKATKLAAFKMGFLDHVTEVAVAGDTKAFEQARVMMTQGKLAPYFSKEEIGAYMEIIKPKVEAARNIERIMKVAGADTAAESGMLAPGVRVGASLVTHAWNVMMNALVTIATRMSPYGSKVAKEIQNMATNPDAKAFNRLIRKTTDLADKQQLNKMIIMAVQAASQEAQNE